MSQNSIHARENIFHLFLRDKDEDAFSICISE